MTSQTNYLDLGTDKIRNLDADAQGGFIAFTDNRKVITNDHSLSIDLEVRFPIIRRLNDDTFLIVDCRARNSANGHIYNFVGQKTKSFVVGDGVEDVVVHHRKIIATYFDEGVFGAKGPNNDGVAVFDFEGNQVFGYNSSAIGEFIVDCYCIGKYENNSVLFYPYSEFKLYKLNLETLQIKAYETPDDLQGTSAISSKGNKIILHWGNADKDNFFFWDKANNKIEIIGTYRAKLKGIENGKFLGFDDKGYTIVDPTE